MEKDRIPALFGSNVFNEDAMRRYLPAEAVSAWRDCLENGRHLGLPLANAIADGMKNWALEHGATHYTHWFQPMTGYTAEKHDGFVTPAGPGRVIMDFSGKELVSGEPDASSFPSGGLRATFEARGYTAWDPTSYAFLKDGSLCIPTVFCSYSGESLDKKTPLLRSVEAVSKQAVRILRLFGDTETHRVIPQVGPEQEYFLIDKEAFLKREDLRLCGRTLFGANPPKGQELDDHYYGAIKPRVAAFMRELDEELWKLGILSKTKHNEVAPSQHEMAPIYSDVNTACDHNQLTMETMKKVADRHDLVCLLHEKPFAGVNGSGKHDNWSLATDGGKNLFAPGRTPSQNAQFLLFLAAIVKGVDDYPELLRCTVASAGNDHRLGVQEAPPAILSVYLGAELEAVIESIVGGTDYIDPEKRQMRIGVDILPHIPQDTTDRNRTSPMAFTGNKFEFRMVGASLSVSGPNIVLNTMMAEELDQFAGELEKADDFHNALHALIRRELTAHKRIIFDGNGYDEAWIEEAKRRGLSNNVSAVDALPAYITEKNIRLFTDHAIYTSDEVHARYNIHVQNYTATISIEARTMIDMLRKEILPAVSSYGTTLCTGLERRKAMGLPSKYEENNARNNCLLSNCLSDACDQLEKDLRNIPADPEEAMRYSRTVLVPDMDECRSYADELETITSRDAWPIPVYSDLLFSEI